MSLALSTRRAALAPGAWVRNELWRRARAVPSLDLRFADSKSLVDATSGQNLVTFTRASSGTYVGSDGLIKTATTDTPRFDHNPTTGESLGLLVEEQRTNLCLQSEDLGTTWTATRATVSTNQALSPSGTTTADKVILDSTANNSHFVQIVPAITANSTITFSAYAKAAEWQYLRIEILGNVSTGDLLARGFNVSNGTAVSAGSATGAAVLSSSGIQDAGSGWYRVFMTGTINATDTAVRIRLALGSSTGGALVNGDGVSGLFLWGAQLEAGAFPTSYIPTTAATATRSADVASISGSNFSSWYRQDEGTVFADIIGFPIASGQFPRIWEVSDGTSNNLIRLQQYSSNTVRVSVQAGGVGQMAQDSGAIAQGTRGKLSLGVSANDCALVVNAGTPSTDASVTVPSGITQATILGTTGGTSMSNSTIRRLTYWPQRLANNVLQTITQ